MKRSLVAIWILALCCASLMDATAGKPGGGGSGSTILVEDLGKPAGSTKPRAVSINDAGTVAIGSAYWDVTWTYPNNWYPVRWTRASTSSPWQAEDLRPLMPPTTWGDGFHVNDAGTVIVRSEDPRDHFFHYLVIPAGAVDVSGTIDLGPNVVVNDLDNAGAMVGLRFDPTLAVGETALFWSSAAAAPEVLPVTEGALSSHAVALQGADIYGMLDDESGHWLVRWTGGPGNWAVAKLQSFPVRYAIKGVSSAGRYAFTFCDPCDFKDRLYHGAFWDPPYSGLPTVLPTLTDPGSSTRAVAEDGAIVGAVDPRTGGMVPVIWPNPGTVTALPLLSGGQAGQAYGINAYRQVVGNVTAVVKGRSEVHAVMWTIR